ncbi:MAG: tetratricopeptide repeat protein [Treponema sp.]|nr:tetratricopeptide repeat protein [Treponema sp.]MEE3435525.1 tetratricopeptide repeat protein [Treponema sp.]
MTGSDQLNSIYYISLPENFELSKNAMHIDKSIPLPVQRKDKDSPDNFNMDELTPEQILSGILTVLAYDKGNKHLDYYRNIIKEARPNLKQELNAAAILKTKNEDFDIAEEIFMALRGFDPEDVAVILNTALFFDQRADSYRRLELHEDADAYDASAEEYYKMAMDNDPPPPDAFFNAGFFYLKRNDFFNARGCFESFLALTCDAKDEDLGENGVFKKERAQQILNEIKNGNMDDSRFKNAYKLIQSGQEEKGLEEIRVFLQHNPNVWNAWFMLGWGLRRLGRYADAEGVFEKALECGGSENADCYNELSICCMEQEKFDKARDCLHKALDIDPENTKIISNLGYLALKLGDVSAAQGYFQTVLEFDPNDKIAAMELERLEKNS